MKKQGLFAFVLLMAAATPASAGNVILLMLDGVRWQEVFNGDKKGPIFTHLWDDYRREGVIFGDVDRGTGMTVSNGAYVSLPAYQSIMAGTTQPCSGNGCGRIKVETVQERVQRELNLQKGAVATIASWEKIPHAVEHTEGATFVNAAFQKLDDGEFDPEFNAINEAQAKDVPPWGGARYDRYTWAHSMRYLKKHQPRFMFVSLNDSDEWGHKGEWDRYVATLKQYDAWIAELISQLKTMGDYGRDTTLIVTTDHGRGEGGNWKHHGWLWPSSKNIWLYARRAQAPGPAENQALFADGNSGYSHVDVRPTIEAALGLEPVQCKQCGHVILMQP